METERNRTTIQMDFISNVIAQNLIPYVFIYVNNLLQVNFI